MRHSACTYNKEQMFGLEVRIFEFTVHLVRSRPGPGLKSISQIAAKMTKICFHLCYILGTVVLAYK